MDQMISLSLDSHATSAHGVAKKKDIRKNGKFQRFILEADSQINIQDSSQLMKQKRVLTQSIEDDLNQEINIKNFQLKKRPKNNENQILQDLNLRAGMNKEDMLDNFLTDLFANNFNKQIGKQMTLDKSLLVSTARKHSVELMMSESGAGMLSNLQVRDGSALGASALHQQSDQLVKQMQN